MAKRRIVVELDLDVDLGADGVNEPNASHIDHTIRDALRSARRKFGLGIEPDIDSVRVRIPDSRTSADVFWEGVGRL
jgi:hypothetical protein